MKLRAFLGRVAALVIFVCLTGTAQQPERNAPPPLATRGAFFALVVTDMNASLRWYESELGLRVIKQGKSPRVAAQTAALAGQNFFVELIHYTDRALPGPKIDDSAPAAWPSSAPSNAITAAKSSSKSPRNPPPQESEMKVDAPQFSRRSCCRPRLLPVYQSWSKSRQPRRRQDASA